MIPKLFFMDPHGFPSLCFQPGLLSFSEAQSAEEKASVLEEKVEEAEEAAEAAEEEAPREAPIDYIVTYSTY